MMLSTDTPWFVQCPNIERLGMDGFPILSPASCTISWWEGCCLIIVSPWRLEPRYFFMSSMRAACHFSLWAQKLPIPQIAMPPPDCIRGNIFLMTCLLSIQWKEETQVTTWNVPSVKSISSALCGKNERDHIFSIPVDASLFQSSLHSIDANDLFKAILISRVTVPGPQPASNNLPCPSAWNQFNTWSIKSFGYRGRYFTYSLTTPENNEEGSLE